MAKWFGGRKRQRLLASWVRGAPTGTLTPLPSPEAFTRKFRGQARRYRKQNSAMQHLLHQLETKPHRLRKALAFLHGLHTGYLERMRRTIGAGEEGYVLREAMKRELDRALLARFFRAPNRLTLDRYLRVADTMAEDARAMQQTLYDLLMDHKKGGLRRLNTGVGLKIERILSLPGLPEKIRGATRTFFQKASFILTAARKKDVPYLAAVEERYGMRGDARGDVVDFYSRPHRWFGALMAKVIDTEFTAEEQARINRLAAVLPAYCHAKVAQGLGAQGPLFFAMRQAFWEFTELP